MNEREVLGAFYANHLFAFIEWAQTHGIESRYTLDDFGIPRFANKHTVDCWCCWIAGAINEKSQPTELYE